MGFLFSLWSTQTKIRWSAPAWPKLFENETQNHPLTISQGTALCWAGHGKEYLLEKNIPLMGQSGKGQSYSQELGSLASVRASLAIREMLPPYLAWGTETVNPKGPARTEVGWCLTNLAAIMHQPQCINKLTISRDQKQNLRFQRWREGKVLLERLSE